MIMYPPGSNTPVIADKSQVAALIAAGWTHEPAAPAEQPALPIKRKRVANANPAD